MGPLTRMLVIAVVVLLVCSLPVGAGNLNGKWLLELGFGQWDHDGVNTELISGSLDTRVGWNDMAVSFTAGHYVQEDIAVILTGTLLAQEARVEFEPRHFEASNITVGSAYFGLRYYLPKSTFEGRWRPYLTAAFGPVVGSGQATGIGSPWFAQVKTETVLGGRFGGGVDLLLSRRVKLGIIASYNAVGDFDSSIFSSGDYSGPEVTFNFGVLLGKHRGQSEQVRTE